MEFPNLGEHCFEKTCNRLDFLPMKCDACSNIFCKDHIQYVEHSCIKSYQKNIQVPVCPLCNKPVPSKRGEQPDIAVGQHIDNDCLSDSAVNKRKIYTNKCSVKGCKQKELIPVTCYTCAKNYCLKHRHPTDHECKPVKSDGTPLSAAEAHVLRERMERTVVQRNMRVINFAQRNTALNRSSGVFPRQMPLVRHTSGAGHASFNHFQAGMSEDEALTLALQNSLNENSQPIDEREDNILAEALAASERQVAPTNRPQHGKDRNCIIS